MDASIMGCKQVRINLQDTAIRYAKRANTLPGIFMIIAISLLCFYPISTAQAQVDSLFMDVQVGFDGYCRVEENWGWCPVRIVVSNEGADIDGEIQVSTIEADADVYCVPALLPGRSRKAFYVYIPADNSSARLSIRLLAEGKEVLSRQVTISSWLGQEDHLYGVVGGQPSAFNFLSDIAPAGGRAAVAYLDLATMPPDPLGWESLDVLILSDIDTAALDSERRQALEAWVSHGGHLIVSGGAGVSRTAAGIAWLLPVVAGGIRSVENLDALGEWTGIAVQPGPYAVAMASMCEGKALIRQGDLILLARRLYGAGRVDFLAFDATLNPFVNWDGRVRLWQSILETRARMVVTPHYSSSARDAVNAIPGLSALSVAQIALFLLIYIVIIGPLNYLVLRRLDRRELAWFTIPAIVAAFTLLAYVTGFQLRGSRSIVHQLVAVCVPEGMDTGRASSITGIFSPRRTSYEVMAAHALVRRLPETDQSGPDNRPLYACQEEEGSLVKLPVNIGGIRSLVTEGYVKVPEVGADLKLTASAGELILEGDVFNGELALSDAVLLTDGGEQRLGELPAGGVAHVSIQYGQVYNSLPDRIGGIYREGQELYRRYRFLQALFPSQIWEPGQGIYLIGWAESSPLPVEIVGKPYRTSSEVLYIYALPVEFQLDPEVSIPPSAIRRRVYSQAGDVRIWGGGFDLGESSEVVFAFSIWPALMVSQVDTMTLEIQGTSYGSDMPTVSLWNRKTYAWEVMPIRWGSNLIPHGENYFLPSATVLVKLETGAEQRLELQSLTITLAGRRR